MLDRIYTFRKIDTPELLQEVYRLRFQVYCKECSFIKEEDYPLGYESDDFDRHAVHFGAFDMNGQLVGTVRMVLPSCERFPIEEACVDLDISRLAPSRDFCAEISRLTISKLYRRNGSSRTEPDESPEKPTAFIGRVSPIALGLCRSMYQECLMRGIRFCLALMEEPLKILLRLHGFVFEPVGAMVDYYGPVTPYVIDVQGLEKKGVFAASKSLSFDPDQEDFRA